MLVFKFSLKLFSAFLRLCGRATRPSETGQSNRGQSSGLLPRCLMRITTKSVTPSDSFRTVFRELSDSSPHPIGQFLGAKRRSDSSDTLQHFANQSRDCSFSGGGPCQSRVVDKKPVPNGGSAAADRSSDPQGRGPQRSAWGPIGGRFLAHDGPSPLSLSPPSPQQFLLNSRLPTWPLASTHP